VALGPEVVSGMTVAPGPVGRFGERVGHALEAHPGRFLFVFVLVYSLVTVAHAKRRFWYDELFTVYLCRLPHFSDIWAALMDGLDFNPPILYLTTRLSHQLLGDSPVTTRFPQMIGFLVMCLCLYVFVRRRCGQVYGFAAMCFPLVTAAYSYSSEARAYGIVLGFCGLSAVSWQTAAQGGRRRIALAVLFFSIAGLILTHCFTVLILIAFGVAELTRLWVRRKTDWPVWTCAVTPLTFALIYIPMLRHVKSYATDSISFKSGLSLAPRFYSYLFNDMDRSWERHLSNETMWPLLIVLTMIALCRFRPVSVGHEPVHIPGFPAHEIAFLVTLSLLPVFGQVLARTFNTLFVDRYGLSAVFGISALLAALAHRVTIGDRRVPASWCSGCFLWPTSEFGLHP
jgi:hypothetical protein